MLPPDLLERARQAIRDPGISWSSRRCWRAELGARCAARPDRGRPVGRPARAGRGLGPGARDRPRGGAVVRARAGRSARRSAPIPGASSPREPCWRPSPRTRVERAQAALAAAGHASARLGRAEAGAGVRTTDGSRAPALRAGRGVAHPGIGVASGGGLAHLLRAARRREKDHGRHRARHDLATRRRGARRDEPAGAARGRDRGGAHGRLRQRRGMRRVLRRDREGCGGEPRRRDRRA